MEAGCGLDGCGRLAAACKGYRPCDGPFTPRTTSDPGYRRKITCQLNKGNPRTCCASALLCDREGMIRARHLEAPHRTSSMPEPGHECGNRLDHRALRAHGRADAPHRTTHRRRSACLHPPRTARTSTSQARSRSISMPNSHSPARPATGPRGSATLRSDRCHPGPDGASRPDLDGNLRRRRAIAGRVRDGCRSGRVLRG